MLGNKGTRKHYRTGGTRGGQDQFKWDDVKGDKDRENYLGHSQMAPVGRWQNGKDIFWYAKKQSDQASILQAEINAIKERDDDLIRSALGLKKPRTDYTSQSLGRDELKQLFSRGETERSVVDIERIEGLGAAPSKLHDHIERGPSMVEKEINNLKRETGAGALRIDLVHDTKRRGVADDNSESQSGRRKKRKHEGKEGKKKKKHNDDKEFDKKKDRR